MSDSISLILPDFLSRPETFPRAELAERLIRWFREQSRELPWRTDKSAYRTWISEIMSQQTRIETVVPYFHAWMQRFPDVESLARASLDEVLEQWQGLGYYRRARFIHQAARQIVAEHGGRLPETVQGLRELKGVGRYTAGAIASLAFGIPAPAVDGNVLRVVSRLFADDADIGRAATATRYEQAVGALIDRRDPGGFNEALIELGATVCTPSSPACRLCPIEELCEARRRGVEQELPIKRNRTKVREERVHAWIVRTDDERLLVARRAPGELLGGLWEFPILAEPPTDDDGDDETIARPDPVDHVFSHIRRRIELHPLGDADFDDHPSRQDFLQRTLSHRYAESQWVAATETADLPLSTMMRKILAAYEAWARV